MLSDRELFISAIAVSLISPISKEISEEARLIILKHIRDSYAKSVTDEEWAVIYDDVKMSMELFEKNAFHGIVAHVSGVRVSLPKKQPPPMRNNNTSPSPTFREKPNPFERVSTMLQSKTKEINSINIFDKFSSTMDRFVTKPTIKSTTNTTVIPKTKEVNNGQQPEQKEKTDGNTET